MRIHLGVSENGVFSVYLRMVPGTRFLGIYTAFRQTQFGNPENTEQETGLLV
jgi:hypothetical protein